MRQRLRILRLPSNPQPLLQMLQGLPEEEYAVSLTGATDDVVCALPAAKSDYGGCGTNKGNKSRCKVRNKKVGLLGFTCRCGDVFCGSHRYAEEHGCSFDVKGMAREILAKQNPLCKGDKLEFRI
ncbi:unnamed protein product [Linum tenue]|uniref:AN1-type domain-containing protein n=2 Tax=Linum tenue TaxID=586396 RepID=A0AAV0QUF3_9ROSI|nr:unnamed protein product [Linum tenue]